MFRAPPKLIYIRWIGAICAAIPLLLFLLMALLMRYLTYSSLIWSLTHFLPMVFFGYILDIVYGVFPRKISHHKYPLVPIITGWLIGYGASYVIGDIASSIILNDFSMVSIYFLHPFGMALSFILLGLLYGFFFYSVYMVGLRFYLRGKLKPYVKKKAKKEEKKSK